MWKTGVDNGENNTVDNMTEKLQNKTRESENMTDEDMRLGQLNNNTTYYDREGKDTKQDVTLLRPT